MTGDIYFGGHCGDFMVNEDSGYMYHHWIRRICGFETWLGHRAAWELPPRFGPSVWPWF